MMIVNETVSFTKRNRVTGESRVHEFKRYDGLLQNEETGKCSGVSNVKGNTEYAH